MTRSVRDRAATLERLRATRGYIPPISLDPRATAHIIVDLQNGFLAPGGISEVAAARSIIAYVNRISHTLRRAGGQNAFLGWQCHLG